MARLWILWLFAIPLVRMAAAECCKDTVAVVESVAGKVAARSQAGESTTSVSAWEWLPAGITLEVGPGATATLLLLNGHRYELAANSRATVKEDALAGITGRIRELKPLPPLPRFVPIADSKDSSPGAVRFRGPNDPQNLYPYEGAVALATSVTLQFSPVRDTSVYDISLENKTGDPVLTARTAATSVIIPPGKLEPGETYSWRVRARSSSGVLGEGAARFFTLSREDVERRARLAESLSETTEAWRLALLADVDLRLGLFAEARSEFEAALRLRPQDPSIERALERARALYGRQ